LLYSGNTFDHNVVQSPPNQWNDALISFTDPTMLVPSLCAHSYNSWDQSGVSQSNWIWDGADRVSLTAFLSAVGDTTSVAGPVTFSDPNRTLASYNGSIGGTATYDAFVAQCSLQSKDYWRTEYTAAAVNTYIHAGFGL
jgi:hypothetical protein